jgi:DNA modification methylase
MTPYYETKLGKLYHGDCLEIMPQLEPVDLVLTDPPYPDYHVGKYKYDESKILALGELNCKQLIFWTSKVDFVLDYSAVHIWDKKTGCGSQYERIFERNGEKNYKLYSHYFINSTVAASFTGDTFTGHPSQKPKTLLFKLLQDSKTSGIVYDPFLGSGTTAIACERLGRKWIGIEISEKYCEIAAKRIESEASQLKLFA